MKSFNFSDEDRAFISLLYGTNPSSENLVQFAILKELRELNEKFDGLFETLKYGVGTFEIQ